MNKFAFPEGVDRIDHAIKSGMMRRGAWGDGVHTVCMMSALVPEAGESGGRIEKCVTAGWPEWLVDLNVTLFDADVSAQPEVNDSTAFQFARDVAEAVQAPRDLDKAYHLFLIGLLTGSKFSALDLLSEISIEDTALIQLIENMVQVLTRRMNGEDVEYEIKFIRGEARRMMDDLFHTLPLSKELNCRRVAATLVYRIFDHSGAIMEACYLYASVQSLIASQHREVFVEGEVSAGELSYLSVPMAESAKLHRLIYNESKYEAMAHMRQALVNSLKAS
jgi:hypothetical protein